MLLRKDGLVLACYDRKTILSENLIDRLEVVIVGLFLLTAIVLGFFAVVFSRKLTTPILQIAAAANRIGQGDLEMKIPVLSRDEIGDLASSFNKMTLDLKASRQELLFSKEYLEGVLKSMMDPLIVVNSKWIIETVNKVTGTLLGYREEQLIGKPVSVVLEGLQCHDEAEFREERRSFKFETSLRSMDGRQIPIFLSGSALVGNDGTFQGMIYVAHNISEIKDAQREKQNRLELEVKTQFLEEQDWVKTGVNKLSQAMSGIQNADGMAEQILLFMVYYLDADAGSIFFSNTQTGGLELINETEKKETIFSSIDNWKTDKILKEVARTGNRIIINSGDKNSKTSVSEEFSQCSILIFPFRFENCIFGVIQLLSDEEYSRVKLEFVNQAENLIGASLDVLFSRLETETLLSESRMLSYELKNQSETVQYTNVQLSEQAFELKKVQHDLKKRNIDLEDAQTDLKLRAKQLELVSKYKSEFLANMSHELRTPLNSILILSNLLMVDKPGRLAEGQKKHARTINDAGSDLLKQINDVLDISKIESGHMDAISEEFYLVEYLHSFADRFGTIAEEKGIALEVALGEGLPEKICSDSEKLKQVISNLLSNAIKFTQKGSVELSAFYEPGGNPDFVSISIRDSGIGVAEDKKEVIFEPFRQVDGSISRRFGGTGLGLSISRKIAKLLGGSLSLKKSDESGSTFLLQVPLSPPVKEENASVKAPPLELPFSQKKTGMEEQAIFLKNIPCAIEKEKEFLDKQFLFFTGNFKDSYSLAAAFEPKGVTVKIAATEKEAVEILEKGTIHVLFIDGDEDHLKEAESLIEQKELGLFASVFFFLIRDSNQTKIDSRSYTTEGVVLLTKPVDFKELLTLLRGRF